MTNCMDDHTSLRVDYEFVLRDPPFCTRSVDIQRTFSLETQSGLDALLTVVLSKGPLDAGIRL